MTYVPRKSKSVVFLSSLHHDAALCDDTGKPDIIEYYNETKGAVDALDQMCAQYTVERATRRWTMAMFYGVVNIASVNAFVVYAHNMRKQQRHMKLKQKEFLLSIARHLVIPFAAQRYKFPRLSKKIKEAMILGGFAPDSHESTVQNAEDEDYRAMAGKRGRCHLWNRGKNVKTQFVCKSGELYACKDHMSMTIVCNACKVRDAEGNVSE